MIMITLVYIILAIADGAMAKESMNKYRDAADLLCKNEEACLDNFYGQASIYSMTHNIAVLRNAIICINALVLFVTWLN